MGKDRRKEKADEDRLEVESHSMIDATEAVACDKLRKDNPDDSTAIAAACAEDRPVDSVNIGLVSTPDPASPAALVDAEADLLEVL